MAESVDRPWKEALLRHRMELFDMADLDDVFLKRLIDHLMTARCLQRDQIEVINGERFSRSRIGKLLDFVAAENEEAFNELCEALKSFGTSAKNQMADSLQRSLKQAKWKTCSVIFILSTIENEPLVGVTSLNKELYSAQYNFDRKEFAINVLDVETLTFRRHLQRVTGLKNVNDMTSCERNQCIYIADCIKKAVHRVTIENTVTQWPVNVEPHGLSVNSACNVLVTCRRVRKVKEFTTDGHLLRKISLQPDIVNPWHAIELTADQLVVCHGIFGDSLHRVCIVNSSGRLLQSVGESRGSGSGQFNVPLRLAVVNEMIFVADVNNHRIVQLSSSLTFLREVVSGLRFPLRTYFDDRTCRLHVADNQVEHGKFVSGQLKVYGV